MKHLVVFVVLVLLNMLLLGNAHAESRGEMFMQSLKDADSFKPKTESELLEIATTWGFLRGVGASYAVIGECDADNAFQLINMSNDQLVLIVLNWMRNNPTEWDQMPVVITLNAYSSSFSCPF